MPATLESLPFLSRLWFAWVCFFRVLFDGTYAAELHSGGPKAALAPPPPPAPKPAEPKETSVEPALQLLALLQREGRLVDFLEEDVATFSDADIGAAARVVHSGCRKALREHMTLAAVRSEDEGAKVTVDGASNGDVKLTGNVSGSGPHTGTLRHRGWKVADVKLPKAVAGHDARVLAQAEVEL